MPCVLLKQMRSAGAIVGPIRVSVDSRVEKRQSEPSAKFRRRDSPLAPKCIGEVTVISET